MLPNCTADLAGVFSPQRRPEAAEKTPKVIVDDRFLFRRLIWSWHKRIARRVRAVPPSLRLLLEVLLLTASLAQLSGVVVLHAALLPSTLSQLGYDPLAARLTEALFPAGYAVELLTIEVSVPSESPRCPADAASSAASCSSSSQVVRCEVAAERSMLELPLALRQGVSEAARQRQEGLVAKVHMDANDLHLNLPVARLPSWSLRGLLVSRILRSLIAGPLREEVIRREPFFSVAANTTQEEARATESSNSSLEEDNTSQLMGSKVHPMVVEKWSLLAWGLAEFGLGVGNVSTTSVGSAALSFLSCEGQAPISLHPLRRLAELVDRRTEWWLFKTVWAFATCVFGFLAAVLLCFAVRGALLGLYTLCLNQTPEPGSGMLYALEAVVLILAPAGLVSAICRVSGSLAVDAAAILICFCAGEACALLLQTQDSRYLFPRAVLPAYIADVYYCFFHFPFGFTWLSHGALFCYQAFLLAVLWGHFESVVPLPTFSLDQLNIEVRFRPNKSQKAKSELSPALQKLLLEQGLLLLGDNTSYETGMVMSAIISRAVQNIKAPRLVLPPEPVGASELLYPGEFLELVHPEALGGGAAIHLLLNRAFAGDARSAAVLAQISARMRKSVRRWPALPYISAQAREIMFSIARQNLVEQLRARRREVPEEE